MSRMKHASRMSHVTNEPCHKRFMRAWLLRGILARVTLDWQVRGRVLTHSWDILTCGVYWGTRWQVILATDHCAVERCRTRDTFIFAVCNILYVMTTNHNNWPVRGWALTQPWHIQMCDICSGETWLLRDTFTCVTPTRSWNVWLVTHSDVWHLLVRDMTHSWHMCDIYMPGLWHIQMYDICSFVTCLIRDTFIDVMSNMTYIQ